MVVADDDGGLRSEQRASGSESWSEIAAGGLYIEREGADFVTCRLQGEIVGESDFNGALDGKRSGCDGGGIAVGVGESRLEETKGVDGAGSFGVEFTGICSVKADDGRRETDQQ